MILSARDLERLKGVHPDLVKVVKAAYAFYGGNVTLNVAEGLRTPERQRELVKANKSQTQNSRHLTGHAVDLAVIVDGKYETRLQPHYTRLAETMKTEAAKLGVPIVWGGDWKTLVDGPHFELDRKVYP